MSSYDHTVANGVHTFTITCTDEEIVAADRGGAMEFDAVDAPSGLAINVLCNPSESHNNQLMVGAKLQV